MVECLGDVLTEGVSRTPGGDAPAAPVVRVGPEQVAHRTLTIFLVVIHIFFHCQNVPDLVRDLLQPVEGADVVEGVDAGGEAAMEAEDLAVHQRGQGQVVKQI